MVNATQNRNAHDDDDDDDDDDGDDDDYYITSGGACTRSILLYTGSCMAVSESEIVTAHAAQYGCKGVQAISRQQRGTETVWYS